MWSLGQWGVNSETDLSRSVHLFSLVERSPVRRVTNAVKKGADEGDWPTQCPTKSMTNNQSKKEPKPEPPRDSKRATKNGVHTIPVQMF